MNLMFRAYDPATDTFIYSKDVAGGMRQFFKLLEDRGIRHFEAEPYIGIDDCDNIDIYLGDRLHHAGLNGTVIYDYNTCSYKLKSDGHQVVRLQLLSKTAKRQIKVVGNIHQE